MDVHQQNVQHYIETLGIFNLETHGCKICFNSVDPSYSKNLSRSSRRKVAVVEIENLKLNMKHQAMTHRALLQDYLNVLNSVSMPE